ncbi:hypothetical protein [Mycobacterium marinum]|uniref:hypothetical protein n=1 Tax=Mycobacterium marinum TaxID=1781 RepID=UPI00115D8456|nr:hypothetical protein [Mycobacterium marinum]
MPGPLGQLAGAACQDGQIEPIVELLIAASGLASLADRHYKSPLSPKETVLKPVENPSVHLVCIAEFNNQYLTFANNLPENIRVSEVIAPGFSGTLLPATPEMAAQLVFDAVDLTLSAERTIVMVGQGITCTPTISAVKLFEAQAQTCGLEQHVVFGVEIAPVPPADGSSNGSNLLLIPAVSQHQNSDADLVAYGRYLSFGIQSKDKPAKQPWLTISPRINSTHPPSPPLSLEPAFVALRVSNWLGDNGKMLGRWAGPRD